MFARRDCLVFLFILFGSFLCAVSAAAAPERPNFIVINIDDMGYADIGPFGSKLNRTPNLDRMASQGRRFTSFYAAPVCSPSRASLMTGCYPKRGLPIPHVLFPGNAEGLAPGEITVAELLKKRDYATAIVGKWHLGDQTQFLPTQQGFDFYFGLPYSNDMGPAEDGVKSNFGDPLPKGKGKGQPPLPWLRNETVEKRVLADDQTTLTARYTDEAVKFIEEHKNGPFFLYLPHSAVHWPIYPGKEFRGKSQNGLYGDWVEEVDASVGRVLDAVRELHLSRKTLVIFTSDNGGTPRAVNTPLRGNKGSTWEGGMRVPMIAWWPDRVPAGTQCDAITGMFDILPTLTKLAGGELPKDRKFDGADISPLLLGQADAKLPHETFYFYRGLKLEAVRQGNWKLHLEKGLLFNLDTDIGEKDDVAAANPQVVARLRGVADLMKDDLGLDGIGPGCRPLGRAADPQPIIDHDGKVRSDLKDGRGK